MKSLSRRFLVSVGIMSLVVTIFSTLGAFVVFQRELSNRQISYLEDYVRERSSNVERRFSNLTALHKAAGEELERRMNRLTDAEVDRLADAYFPLRPDGTRRSRDRYFDGAMQDGQYIYGMGVMVGGAKTLTPDEKRALVASFELVANFGQAARKDYDNFYFFAPPETRLVLFGPDRPDKLMFYRHEAPADLDISKEEMSTLTSPKNDPGRLTRCTNLQRLIQDEVGERLATACLTPAYVNGRHVGAFGSSIELTGFLANAVKTSLPGASSLLVTGKGELIAYPGFTVPGKAAEKTVIDYEHRLGLKAMIAAIRKTGRTSGVINSPDGQQIVAFGRLAGPDWYLMLAYPKAAVAASAAKSASWVLGLGALATALQTLLVVYLARRTITWPLQRLAASCEPGAPGDTARPDVSAEEGRDDEIGVLARALSAERDKTETVLASLEERVQERTAQLERANTEKSRFLANMSHELRTPLNGVIAISETLSRQQDTPKGKELAELIVSSGRLLERVLTDILDFSKIEAGEIKLSRDEFSMTTLVSRIAELHRASAETKGLDFAWSVAPEADRRFAGDTVRLTQVLSNLLSNAVKFTEAGEVRLEVDAAGGTVGFTVADTGIGFSEEVRERLFRRFEQADASIRRRFGGTGLGLAISRSLVELMDGSIEVASEPGRGSTFSVQVPLERVEGEAEEVDENPFESFDISGARILLAEDHPTNQKVVQLVLDSVGIDPVIVENGALALEALRAARFDVVLMDMQMPELDGLSATTQLRVWEHEHKLPRTPVIMLTANALDEHVKASFDAGADQHLSKPIRADALIEAIIHAMAETQARADEEAAA
ncbi:MAG: response regulator [Alphaproteobacteria bacterium]|nr:response regulator [Alphaproteobacteria bacterium]MBU1515091.1 response regulator [Alphaproteobacteria bacterium]MBU2093449.1 response regulator [Alphaproteobacteria bacterium]MBU2152297.1 response regulator [Alphaproteobacteria bacterium]MBU2308111.1 response regulator [Alphaproteobacteria bacterium]